MRHVRVPLVLAAVFGATVAAPLETASVLPLRIERGGRETAATCWLVHREDVPHGVVLHFMTAAHLFQESTGVRLPLPDGVKVLLPDGLALEVLTRDITLPAVPVVDVALLRTVVSDSDLRPLPVAFSPPPLGSLFHVSGIDAGGLPGESAQRVRIRTSSLLLGNHEAALQSCDGAPAIHDGAVFGVVVSCGRSQVVVVSLLELAEPFLRHQIHGFAAATRATLEPR